MREWDCRGGSWIILTSIALTSDLDTVCLKSKTACRCHLNSNRIAPMIENVLILFAFYQLPLTDNWGRSKRGWRHLLARFASPGPPLRRSKSLSFVSFFFFLVQDSQRKGFYALCIFWLSVVSWKLRYLSYEMSYQVPMINNNPPLDEKSLWSFSSWYLTL